MPRVHESREQVFLQIGFNSPRNDGILKTIEIIGVPGEKLINGECVVSEKAQNFFDDLIVKPIFMKSRRLQGCDFRYLKIWVYHSDIKNGERGYKVPNIDQNDLIISSSIPSSGIL